MTNEIVPYNPNEESVVVYRTDDNSIQLQVKLEHESVWLTQDQMAELFQRDKSVIARHISNIYAEGELDKESTVAKFAIVPEKRERQYEVTLYNLDVIISVGYRVKSKRGTQFRQWALKIIKDYLLKGYAVNQQLLHLEERIDHRFQAIEQRVAKTEEQVDFFVRTSLPPVEQIFFKGEFFVARVIFEKIVKTATKRVIIIDEYIDAATFEMLDVRAKGVTADIYSNGLHATLRDAHNKTTGLEPIQTHKWRNASHDRWIIADDTLYHCGHSLKDTGNKLSCIDVITSISADVVLNYVR